MEIRSFGARISLMIEPGFGQIFHDRVMNITFEVNGKSRQEIAESIKKYEKAVWKMNADRRFLKSVKH